MIRIIDVGLNMEQLLQITEHSEDIFTYAQESCMHKNHVCTRIMYAKKVCILTKLMLPKNVKLKQLYEQRDIYLNVKLLNK